MPPLTFDTLSSATNYIPFLSLSREKLAAECDAAVNGSVVAAEASACKVYSSASKKVAEGITAGDVYGRDTLDNVVGLAIGLAIRSKL